ncbi:MAG: lipid II flippase MurJ [Candidatus Paceibacterota bacterium]|jgi:putative peptidoglycan lipid II flippase
MVKRIFKVFSREISGLHQAAYLLAFFSFLSQILALVRDRLFAASFGASHTLDLYYAAFRIPDFIYVSVASMVSISVLIPFFMERIEKDKAEAKKYIDNLFSAFFLIITSVSIIAYILTPALIRLMYPQFTVDHEIIITLTRILLLSPILLGISNFLASITQIFRRFFIYALSPILYNIGIICGVIFLYPTLGIKGVVFGVILGGLLHVGVQVPFVVSRGFFPRIIFRINWRSIRQVLILSLPRTITISSNEIAELFIISLASILSAGSISIFSLSFNLQSVPLSIIGVSYALAAFPILTKLFTNKEETKFAEHMIMVSKHIIFWAMPVTILFIVLRAQIVRVLFGTGNFGWTDTRLTAAALAIFAVALVPQALTMLFVRAYYSRGDTWKPLAMNIFSALIIIVSSFGFVKLYGYWDAFRYFIESLMKVVDVPGGAVLMLPLGYSLGTIVNTILHWIAFEIDFRGFSRAVFGTFFQTFVSSVLMGFASYNILNILGSVFNLNTFTGIFAQGFIAGIVGIGVGIFALLLLGNIEVKEIWKALHRRIWGVEIIGPDPKL